MPYIQITSRLSSVASRARFINDWTLVKHEAVLLSCDESVVSAAVIVGAG
jgi:hypothetical protein